MLTLPSSAPNSPSWWTGCRGRGDTGRLVPPVFLGLFVFKTFLGGHPQAFVRGHLGHVLPRALIGGPGAPTLWGEVAPPLKRLGMATPQRQQHNQPHGRFGHVTFTEFPSRPEPPAALPAPTRSPRLRGCAAKQTV